jgi:hypothetical protein
MVRKPVKTAVKHHGGGLKEGADAPIARTSERITAVEAHGPATNMERFTTFELSQGARGLYKRFRRKHWNITEVQDPSFGSVGDRLHRRS